ncbi:unnamed protein product [Absidia cylindrospora]
MTAAVSHPNHVKTGLDTSTNNAKQLNNTTAANIASQDVGLLFVREYYTFLNKKPFRLHAFYNKDSLFVRGDEGEAVQTYHGQEEIRQKIEELNFEDCKVLVTQVDSQISSNDGILIQVLGEMCVMDGPSQKFSQTFFLAPQPNGYYVLNDIFRFLKDEVDIDYYTCEDDQQHQQQILAKKDQLVEQQAVTEDTKQPQQPDPVPIMEQQHEQQEKQPSVPVASPAVQHQMVEIVAPVVEKSVEHATVVEPKPDEKKKKPSKEEALDKGMMTNGVAIDGKKNDKSRQQQSNKVTEKTATPATPRSWANLAANDSSKWGTQVSESKGSVAANATPATTGTQPSQTQQTQPQTQTQPIAKEPTPQPQAPPANKEQSRKDEVTNIFVKNVNSNLNEAQLSEAFSKFGPVKSLNIVHTRNCAFLDFTTPEACQKALAQHKVNVGTTVVLAEERRRYGGNSGNMNRQQQQHGNGAGGNFERRHQNNHRRGGNNNAGGGGATGGRNTNSNNNNNNNPGNAKSRTTGNPQK